MLKQHCQENINYFMEPVGEEHIGDLSSPLGEH